MRINTVKEISLEDGEQLPNFVDIKETSYNHFNDLYLEKDVADLDVSTHFLQGVPDLVTREENSELTREMEDEEIIRAIWGLELENDLGPNGFSIYFYHAC
jgi:hypothetical protein